MAVQTVFKRYELKYLINEKLAEEIMLAAKSYSVPDAYGRTVIRNVYYDTDNYRLIRRSLEKPDYKEKLRLRSYKKALPDSTVFAELKKKYNKVTYKRRLPVYESAAEKWLQGGECYQSSQISREIDYFIKYYGGLNPAVFLSYEREAFYLKDTPDFRMTFDRSILCRNESMSLEADVYGLPLLSGEQVLMELKCTGAIPLWLVSFLSSHHIYNTSFSKYGTAYKALIFQNQIKEVS